MGLSKRLDSAAIRTVASVPACTWLCIIYQGETRAARCLFFTRLGNVFLGQPSKLSLCP